MIKPSDIDKLLANNKEEVMAFQRTVKMPIIESSITKIENHLNSGIPVMFISADRWNQSEAFNNHSREDLMNDIIFNNLTYIPMSGAWKGAENDYITYERSFMVTGYVRGTNEYIMDFNEFKKLGLQWREDYDQDSVIIGQGKNGRYNFILYSLDRKYGTINTVKFNDVAFGTPTEIERFYKKYVEYKLSHDKTYEDEGYGYSILKNQSSKGFSFRNEDETEFKKNVLKESVIFANFYCGIKYHSNGYGMAKLDKDFFRSNDRNRDNFFFDVY